MRLLFSVDAGTVLFPLSGVRLTTILAISLFLAIAITREDRRYAYACVAWLFSFEAVFEATALATGRKESLGAPHALSYVAAAAVLLPWVWRHGVRPSWPLLALALIVYAAWVGTGFHVNDHTMTGFDPAAEFLNEASKMLWAAAFLLPLLSEPGRAGQGAGVNGPGV